MSHTESRVAELPSLGPSPLKMCVPSKRTTVSPSKSQLTTLPGSIATPSTMISTDASSFASRIQFSSLNLVGPQESKHDYILLFNRSSGTPKVYYMMVHPTKRGRVLPKLNYVTMSKVRDLAGYRVVVLNNFVYVIGGRNLESSAVLNLCYR